MKKKLNAKEKREAQRQEKQKAFASKQSAVSGAESTPAATMHPGDAEKKTEVKIKTKKSSAKRAGLKSAFILSDSEVLMTSFGRGNDAVIEKYIRGDEITPLNPQPAFETERVHDGYSLIGRVAGRTDNPLQRNDERADKSDKVPQLPGMDILGLKPSLEQRFFDAQEGLRDNIHIQTIYNILDIEKILAPHINDICYVVNNLRRDSNPDNDFVGYLGLRNSYKTFKEPEKSKIKEEKIIQSIQKSKASFDRLMDMPQRAYLGDAIFNTKLKKGTKESDADYKRYYYTLCLLGMARQSLFHGNEAAQPSIYQLGPEHDGRGNWSKTEPGAREEAREVLDSIYAARVQELNHKFLSMAQKDLVVIFRVYGADTAEKKKEYVRKYYDFIVRKEEKNLGFSLKKLREIILAGPDEKTVSDSCDLSMRSKFIKNFDFASALFYQEHPERISSIVESLRASDGDEEREVIYQNEADRLWEANRSLVINNILPLMDAEEFKKIKEDQDVKLDMIGDIIIPMDADYFSKFIYMLTLFLDGKEINELITQLISKFESIASFIDVMKERGIYEGISEDYAMFERSATIAKELRIINSFARMQKDSPLAKKTMYVEAAQILGFDGSDDGMEDYLELILTKDARTREELQKKLKNLPRPDKGFRNFIVNNVIESSRFKYLVRYTDPATVKELARNDQVLKLVLKEIPDEQIARYYTSCIYEREASPEAMRDELRRMLRQLSFLDFAEVDQRSDAKKNDDKQKKQAILRLYLTVLYLAVKNLVKINARYTLAFHCFERDYKLLEGRNVYIDRKQGTERYEESLGQYYQLTKKFIEEKRLNKKSRLYLQENMDHSDCNVIHTYRNQIAHLNMVRNAAQLVKGLKKTDSYFALYHYLMQSSLIQAYEKGTKGNAAEINPIIRDDYFKSVKQYGKYRKDFVKALNVPFGYNLPRYKNLSIEGLFDMHNPGDSGRGELEGD